ncbi:hypothetical protein V496_04454 [Pseudogymnoascus sp. VKM F-4515 (FW-2607)]|nr:hypothetical protein V496_04454 [Pseudogymnoascus sp. VKM F-4515 (FW-2607)]KFY99202.1 hypothetical protein V498_00930 [Pseudogymnoascus sp. VKM F-4517 (FW-2822)]
MGSQPSRLSHDDYTEKQAVERMRQLALTTPGDRGSYEAEGNEKQRPRYVADGTSSLSIGDVAKWQEKLMDDPKNRLALSALSAADPKTVLQNRNVLAENQHIFNVKIPFEGAPITNQNSSGRCWIFAATNVFRVALMKRHNLEAFELSQSYLFFWDKLEKANWFLENTLDTADEDVEGRLVQRLLQSPVGDGGQWDMIVNLVNKYGLVPQVLYPDSFNASHSGTINNLLTTKLRENALTLRSLAATSSSHSTIRTAKAKMMREVQLILTLTLGPPPSPSSEFTWNYLDASGTPKTLKTSPLDFAAELSSPPSIRTIGVDVNSMFSLVNDPRNAPNTLLTVSRLGNVVGATSRPVTYVNVAMPTMKAAIIAMLRADIPVFFGCDVGQSSERTRGVMATGLIDFELGFNVRLGLTKRDRILAGESKMTHAMVLTAVHLDDEGKSVRWRVQNSWGEASGEKGWFVMSDEWMDEFTYQAVVDPRFVSKEVREVLKQDPKVLPLWDPMGELA